MEGGGRGGGGMGERDSMRLSVENTMWEYFYYFSNRMELIMYSIVRLLLCMK